MKGPLFLALFIVFVFRFEAQTTYSCSAASTVCGCSSGSVHAEFYATYFNDVQSFFSTTSVTVSRYDAAINYSTNGGWGSIVPPATGSTADPNSFSTRWSGRLSLAAGTYTFWLTSDDASWLWLGGNALAATPSNTTAFINNSGLHSSATVSASAIFTTNCLQDFKLHYGENTGSNICILEYGCTALGIARQAVPSAAMCGCMSNAVLPIELKDFYGNANKDNVMLYWSTATEQNNRLFTVFRSTDGISWSLLGQQSGGGTTESTRKYTMQDNSPLFGTNYYYLTQTDDDGTMKKFDVISVDFSDNNSYLKLFPNPFQDKFMITSSTAWTSADAFELYDSFGMPVNLSWTQTDSYTIEMKTVDLPKGYYTLKIHTAYQVIVKKLVKG